MRFNMTLESRIKHVQSGLKKIKRIATGTSLGLALIAYLGIQTLTGMAETQVDHNKEFLMWPVCAYEIESYYDLDARPNFVRSYDMLTSLMVGALYRSFLPFLAKNGNGTSTIVAISQAQPKVRDGSKGIYMRIPKEVPLRPADDGDVEYVGQTTEGNTIIISHNPYKDGKPIGKFKTKYVYSAGQTYTKVGEFVFVDPIALLPAGSTLDFFLMDEAGNSLDLFRDITSNSTSSYLEGDNVPKPVVAYCP